MDGVVKKMELNRLAQYQALRQDGSKLFPQGSIPDK